MLKVVKNQETSIDTRLDRSSGYTLIEILGVTAIIIIVVLMTHGMIRHYKKYSIEESAVQRLNELAQYQNIYRHTNDPTVNPEGDYGTFFDLQNANLIADVYEQSDERRHTVNAFIPHYRILFSNGDSDMIDERDESEPDSFHYLIKAVPLYNSLDLKTFYVQEDGEVYFYRHWWIEPR